MSVFWNLKIVKNLLKEGVSMTESSTSSKAVIVSEEERKQLQHLKNEAAKLLLNQWLSDKSGYDEKAWPQVVEALEQNRISIRKRFSE